MAAIMEFVLSPIKFLYLLAYTICIDITKSYALALPLLSVMTVTIIYFCHHRAAALENEEKLIRSIIEPQVTEIKEKYHGAERQAAIERLYSRYAYSPLYAVREAAGVLLQLPFLFGAYAMISTFPHLGGVSLGPISDLSQPDGLLGGVNLLPFVMTGANLATVFLATPAKSREQKQGVVSALIFLALLYGAPSALLVYWTGNNILYLGQEVWKQSRLIAKIRKDCGIDRAAGFISGLIGRLVSSIHFKSALVISLEVLIFTPLITYYSNGCTILGDFPYTGVALAKGLLPMWLRVFAILYVVFAVLGKIKIISVPAVDGRVSYAELFVTGAAVAFLLEGSILGYGLPILDGRQNLFRSTPRLIFDTLVWAGIILFFLVRAKSVAKRFSAVLVGLFAACLVLLAVESAGVDAEEVSNKVGAFGLHRASNYGILDALKYSDKNNVIIILYDSLDTPTVEKTIENHPEFRDVFENFVIYRNNLWAGGHTRHALPQMATGKLYDKVNYYDFLDEAALGESSLAASSAAANRSTYIMSIPTLSASNEPIKQSVVDGTKIQVKTMHHFKFYPYYLKQRKEESVNHGARRDGGWRHEDREILSILQEKMAQRSERPVTMFVYLEGIHVPYTWDENGNKHKKLPETFKSRLGQATTLLRWTKGYIDALKAAGLYDCSTLIITADHGFGRGHKDDIFDKHVVEQSPVMMVKYANARHPLASNEAPLSGRDLKRIAEISFNNDETLPARIDQFLSGLPKEREFYLDRDDWIYLAEGVDRDKLSIKKIRKHSDK